MKSTRIEYLLFRPTPDGKDWELDIAYEILYDGQVIGMSRKIIKYGKIKSDPDIKSYEQESLVDISKSISDIVKEVEEKANLKEGL